jgi:AcrR family transcriptional regulator
MLEATMLCVKLSKVGDTTRRPGGRSSRVRRAVLDATMQLLVEDGPDAATIPAIAERSGVYHTSIYRRWKNRGAVIHEAILDAVDTVTPVPDTGGIRTDLIEVLNEVRRLLQSPLGAVLLDLARSRDESLAELQQTYWDGRLDRGSVIVERAMVRGELPAATDHRLVFELLVGPLHARTLLSRGHLDSIRVEVIVDVVLDGITNRPATFAPPTPAVNHTAGP